MKRFLSRLTSQSRGDSSRRRSRFDQVGDLRKLDLLKTFGQDLDPRFETRYAGLGFNQDQHFFRREVERFGFEDLGKVLDVGCGYGRWTIFLAEVNRRVVGVDSNLASLEIARRLSAHLGIDNAEYLGSSVEHTPFATDEFDGVWIHSVISFVPRSKLLCEAARLLKPGGRMFIGGCNGLGRVIQKLVDGYQRGGLSDRLCRSARTALQKGPAYDGPPSYATRASLIRLLEQYGFSLLPSDPFQDSHTGSLSGEEAEMLADPSSIPQRFEEDEAFRAYLVEHHRRLMVGVEYDFWFTASRNP